MIPSNNYLEDTGPGGSYGHRKDHSTDPKNGYISRCVYEMTDEPGIPNPSSNYTYMFRFEFMGVIFDFCRQVPMKSKSWVVQTQGAGKLPGPAAGGSNGAFHSADETDQSSVATATSPGLMEEVQEAPLPVGAGHLEATIWRYGPSEQSLNIVYAHPTQPTATAIADLQVTLFLTDGTSLQPPQNDPEMTGMDGIAHGGWVSENALYDLKGIALEQVNAVQVVFRGQSSERVAFKAQRPVEQLAR